MDSCRGGCSDRNQLDSEWLVHVDPFFDVDHAEHRINKKRESVGGRVVRPPPPPFSGRNRTRFFQRTTTLQLEFVKLLDSPYL
eukprot:gene19849-biopygen825